MDSGPGSWAVNGFEAVRRKSVKCEYVFYEEMCLYHVEKGLVYEKLNAYLVLYDDIPIPILYYVFPCLLFLFLSSHLGHTFFCTYVISNLFSTIKSDKISKT